MSEKAYNPNKVVITFGGIEVEGCMDGGGVKLVKGVAGNDRFIEVPPVRNPHPNYSRYSNSDKVDGYLHLRLCMRGVYEENATDHPQLVMKRLGITYQHATPQSMGDQWWFWNCENVPVDLPEFLTILEVDPMECVGFGLSEDDARRIRDYKGGDK